MLEADFLKHLNKLRIIMQKKVASSYIGERESMYVGRGSMFRDHRIYVPGDDIRDIDWKVFARTDRFHIKQYEDDRSLTVHIILDYSASMNFGERIKKYEYAAMLGIAYAYIAWKNNERFVLSTFADSLDRFKAQQGKKQMAGILEYLREKKPGGKSKFKDSLVTYAKQIETRSMVVVVSDFLYDLREIEEVLAWFKTNDVVLIQVLDEAETEIRLKGEFQLKDSETQSIMKTSIDEKAREKYLDQLADHKQRLDWIAGSIGARFFSFSTDIPIFDAVYNVLRK